jgi:hypothetical protein
MLDIHRSNPALLGALDLEDLLLGLDVGECVLVVVLASGDGLCLLAVVLVVLVEEGVFEVGDGDAVPAEEPLFELLNKGCFEGGDVLVELDDLVAQGLDLLEFQLVVPLAEFLLLDQFEFLLVDDVLGQLLLRLVLLLLVDT